MDKKETRLLKIFDKCRTRKCSKYMKKRKTETKRFRKELAIKCPQKDSHRSYECSKKFYKGSKLEKLANESEQCSDKKCSAQKLKIYKYRNTMYGVQA